MIKKGLITLLEADNDITTIVSTRIYVDRIPQSGSSPCVVLSTSGTERVWSNDGPTGIPTASIEIDCFSETYLQAITIADEIRLCLDGYTGSVGSQTIHACFLENQVDLSDNVEPGTDIAVYRIRLSFAVHFVEATS